nr:MAG TPA: hypothetical protein [Caudoviricetes sp.]
MFNLIYFGGNSFIIYSLAFLILLLCLAGQLNAKSCSKF